MEKEKIASMSNMPAWFTGLQKTCKPKRPVNTRPFTVKEITAVYLAAQIYRLRDIAKFARRGVAKINDAVKAVETLKGDGEVSAEIFIGACNFINQSKRQ